MYVCMSVCMYVVCTYVSQVGHMIAVGADFISDLTMARQGFPRMGVSACFGGPLLSMHNAFQTKLLITLVSSDRFTSGVWYWNHNYMLQIRRLCYGGTYSVRIVDLMSLPEFPFCLQSWLCCHLWSLSARCSS